MLVFLVSLEICDCAPHELHVFKELDDAIVFAESIIKKTNTFDSWIPVIGVELYEYQKAFDIRIVRVWSSDYDNVIIRALELS